MIRKIRRSMKRRRVTTAHRSGYAQYTAAQARKKQTPLPYRQWREARLKNSLAAQKALEGKAAP